MECSVGIALNHGVIVMKTILILKAGSSAGPFIPVGAPSPFSSRSRNS